MFVSFLCVKFKHNIVTRSSGLAGFPNSSELGHLARLGGGLMLHNIIQDVNKQLNQAMSLNNVHIFFHNNKMNNQNV